MTIILIFSQMSPVMADNAAIEMQMGRQSDINKQLQQMHSHNQSNCYLGSFLQLVCYQPLSFYSDQTCHCWHFCFGSRHHFFVARTKEQDCFHSTYGCNTWWWGGEKKNKKVKRHLAGCWMWYDQVFNCGHQCVFFSKCTTSKGH